MGTLTDLAAAHKYREEEPRLYISVSSVEVKGLSNGGCLFIVGDGLLQFRKHADTSVLIEDGVWICDDSQWAALVSGVEEPESGDWDDLSGGLELDVRLAPAHDEVSTVGAAWAASIS